MAAAWTELGRSGIRVPKIGMGTWRMGARPDTEFAAIREGMRLGMKLVDTAEAYATERLVGRALEGSHDAVVATKVLPSHMRRDSIAKACRRSIALLGVRAVDLYMVHWPNPKVSIGETIGAMERLVDAGLVRSIGVSNFSTHQLDEAVHALKRYDIAACETEYSLLVRDAARGIIPYCTRNRISVIAYSPFCRGRLFAPRQAHLLSRLGEVGAAHGMTAAQVALAWTISGPGVIAIPKASDVSHVRENAGALGARLSRREMSYLAEAALSERPIANIIGPTVKLVPSLASAYAAAMRLRNRKSAGHG